MSIPQRYSLDKTLGLLSSRLDPMERKDERSLDVRKILIPLGGLNLVHQTKTHEPIDQLSQDILKVVGDVEPEAITVGGRSLIAPFVGGGVTCALEKLEEGSYAFIWKQMGKFQKDPAMNDHRDLWGAFDAAMGDVAGLGLRFRDQRIDQPSGRKITVEGSEEAKAAFEAALSFRIRELADPEHGRTSRHSPARIGMGTSAQAAEISGFASFDEAKKAIDLPCVSGANTSSGEPWRANFPRLVHSEQSCRLIVDSRYLDLPMYGRETVLTDAAKSPMVPHPTEGGAWLVFSAFVPSAFGSFGEKTLHVFQSQEQAKEFVRTHRFVDAQPGCAISYTDAGIQPFADPILQNLFGR